MTGLVCGVGINDSTEPVTKTEIINGKKIKTWICPFYQRWHAMINRCYNENYQKKHPTYSDCKVCEEWKIFSNFKRWVVLQEWKERHLDKDLLIKGNKLYSPETCVFISSTVNNFLTDSLATRGRYLLGVSYISKVAKYRATCRNPFTLKSESLGSFENEIDAHVAWKTRKHFFAESLASTETDQRVVNALLTRYKEKF